MVDVWCLNTDTVNGTRSVAIVGGRLVVDGLEIHTDGASFLVGSMSALCLDLERPYRVGHEGRLRCCGIRCRLEAASQAAPIEDEERRKQEARPGARYRPTYFRSDTAHCFNSGHLGEPKSKVKEPPKRSSTISCGACVTMGSPPILDM